MPDTPNYDYLKPVLGEEIFGQFAEKMAAAQGIQLANVGDGAYIPKAKYDADKRQLSSQITQLNTQLQQAQAAGANAAALNQQVAQLTADLAARDKTIADSAKRGLILAELRNAGARDPELLVRLIDMDKVTQKDGRLEGLDDQLNPMKTAQPYLFGNLPGGRGGLDTHSGGAGAETTNQQVNDEIRRAAGR